MREGVVHCDGESVRYAVLSASAVLLLSTCSASPAKSRFPAGSPRRPDQQDQVVDGDESTRSS